MLPHDSPKMLMMRAVYTNRNAAAETMLQFAQKVLAPAWSTMAPQSHGEAGTVASKAMKETAHSK